MRTFTLLATLFPLLIIATPVPIPAPNPEPIDAAAFTDFPVNIIMLAGPAQFGVWVQPNGLLYSTTLLTCLNAGANSYGACSTPSYDHVGVVAGNGPCTFVGANGDRITLQGKVGEGFASIAPPQQITNIACG